MGYHLFYCGWCKEKALHNPPPPPEVLQLHPWPLSAYQRSQQLVEQIRWWHTFIGLILTSKYGCRGCGSVVIAAVGWQNSNHTGAGYKVQKSLFWDTPRGALMVLQSCFLRGAEPKPVHIPQVWDVYFSQTHHNKTPHKQISTSDLDVKH